MANMLVADVLWCYELPVSARRLTGAYSDIATQPQTTEPPGAKHARWYLRREAQRGGNPAFHMRGCKGTSQHGHSHPPTRPSMDAAQAVSEVWWVKRPETPATPRCP
jgi:hypothetical protein